MGIAAPSCSYGAAEFLTVDQKAMAQNSIARHHPLGTLELVPSPPGVGRAIAPNNHYMEACL
eukprot:11214389-Lingulodinium_polyedra.AAC.1